ncbi:MAG: sugar ABC transporter substrate-binding protein [Propionivibrio sp.]
MHRHPKTTAVACVVSALLAIPVAQAAGITEFVAGYSSSGFSYPYPTYPAAIAKGFNDAAAKVGARTILLDAKGSVQKQASDIDDLIAQKVDGIAIMPLDSIIAQTWAERTAAAGIPTVAVASPIGDPSQRDVKDVYEKLVALVAQDEISAGMQAGNIALQLLPWDREARIAIVEGAAGYAEVRQRTEGFEKALKDAGLNYTIVAAQPGDWSAEKGEAVCQNILAANPNVDLFFNQADDMMIGCARAVRSVGSRARLVGMGGSRLAMAAIKAGKVDGTVCYQPEAIGQLAFNTLYKAATGKQLHQAEFVSYDTPGVTLANADQCVGQW